MLIKLKVLICNISDLLHCKSIPLAVVLFWISLGVVSPGNSLSKEVEQKLQIDFSFTNSDAVKKKIISYNLYKDGELTCKEMAAVDQSISCKVILATGTHDFTLAAVYEDGSESPQSPAFSFFVAPNVTFLQKVFYDLLLDDE